MEVSSRSTFRIVCNSFQVFSFIQEKQQRKEQERKEKRQKKLEKKLGKTANGSV